MPFYIILLLYIILDYLTLLKFEISKINTFKLQRYGNMIKGRGEQSVPLFDTKTKIING